VTRAVLVCPGRGSYSERSLGSLPAGHDLVRRAEALRAELGLEPLLMLDGAARFEPARHLRPAHVSALIYVVSMLDAEQAEARHELVAVAGNSMGWYTALAAAGALSFEDGFRLVQRMALLQEHGEPGGQLVYPRVDDEWQVVPAQEAALAAALEHPGLHSSIRLGGYAVLAGTPSAVAHALQVLPTVQLGQVTYPLRLAQHGPYHTPLVRKVSELARVELAQLEFRRPRVTLIDGLGRRHSPWSADVRLLRDYTFGEQVTRTYDLTRSVEVALKEFAPERLVLAGPGNTLGGVCGQVLLALGWRGLRTRAAFAALQAGDAPVLESLGR
jgi:malonyl CoA-acyl carrier protein transacylase